MAIAGSGGWVPSCRVVMRFDRLSGRGGLVATGIVQNKPGNLVFSDEAKDAYGTLSEGLAVLRSGKPIQVDMRNGQYLRLLEMWKGQEVGGEDHGEG